MVDICWAYWAQYNGIGGLYFVETGGEEVISIWDMVFSIWTSPSLSKGEEQVPPLEGYREVLCKRLSNHKLIYSPHAPRLISITS